MNQINNANKRHFDQTNIQREQNLKEDLAIWNFIITLNDNDIKIEGKNNKGEFSISHNLKNQIEKEINSNPDNTNSNTFFKARIETLCKKIWSKRSRNFNIVQEDQVDFKMVRNFAKMLIDSPIEIQLEFCRDPVKQSINEKISFLTLKEYLDPDLWSVEKPPNGYISVEDEKIKYNDGNNKKLVDKARSVDFYIKSKKNPNIEFFGFAKFSKDKGSGQSLQAGEAKTFLNECKDYCESNNDSKFFFCLIDGKEGEKAIQDLKPIVRFHKTKIFVGNSFEIIDEIKKHE